MTDKRMSEECWQEILCIPISQFDVEDLADLLAEARRARASEEILSGHDCLALDAERDEERDALRAELELLRALPEAELRRKAEARAEAAEAEVAQVREANESQAQQIAVIYAREERLRAALTEIAETPCDCKKWSDGSHYHDCASVHDAVDIARRAPAMSGEKKRANG